MYKNYRTLNQQTKPDKYPLPRIYDLLDSLVNAYCLSSIDLYTSYQQLAIRPGNEYKTPFLSRYGLFEFLVLLFGLKNSPSIF